MFRARSLRYADHFGLLAWLRSSIRRNWRSIFIVLTILADALAILGASLAAGWLHALVPNGERFSTALLVAFSVYFGTVMVGFGLLIGLYRGAFHLSHRKQYLLASRAYVVALLVVLASFFLFQVSEFPRRFALLFFMALPGFFVIGRAALNAAHEQLQRRGLGRRPVLLAGYDGEVEELLDRFEGVPELGYDVRGIVTRTRSEITEDDRSKLRGLPLYSLKELESAVVEQRIERIFVPTPSVLTNGFAAVLRVCREKDVKLKVLSIEHDALLRLARVYDIAGITLYAPPRTRVEAVHHVGKRTFDIVGSAMILLLLSPVFFLTSLLILLDSGRPIFFTQTRAALRGGKTFGFLKFRSMVKNADALKADLRQHNESDGALFKMRADPRITRVGRFIRRYSIDELPQLLNVLKGDMSLVGPRPLPVEDFELVKEGEEFWSSIKDRDKIKPGMTGLWQISGRSSIGFKEMVMLDLYYVENHSLLFDLEILFATIPVVLFGKGAY
ncbi:MAG: sugar transferase [Bacteroidetes bacterium]|jgi:exopolysaccharide biosynthesis polyprenyl glycosylphosphotransferase|nr:sugar transferase [Bacteroidota bacterium]